MKKETENKQVFSFKKGHTLPMSDESFDFLENCQKALLIGNLRGMIVDNNDDGKPSFFQTTGIGDKKAKMAFTFYKRFSDINKFTHFLVHEDDVQYYKDFIENFALENCQIITHRLRGKSTEYKIAFVPPVVSRDFKSSFNIRNEYLQDMETLAKFEVGSAEQDKQIKYMLHKYVAICLNYTDGKLNEVYTDHGNITVIVYKDNKMFTNVYSKVNKITGEKIEFRDFDNVPKMFNDRINGFKGKKTMTYDFILMNPPYDKNLHLKIVEQSIPMLTDDGILINLSPIRWLQDPLAKYKKSSDWYKFKEVRIHLKDLLVVKADEAETYFSIRQNADLGVYVLDTKNHCFELDNNESFIRRFEKCMGLPIEIYDETKHDFFVHVRRLLGHTSTFTEICRDYWWSHGKDIKGDKWNNNLPKAKNFSEDRSMYGVSFRTEQEAINFYYSTKSIIYRYYVFLTLTGIDCQFKYMPFMGDCTNPRTGLKGYEGEWTDEDFYEYFNITEKEREEIECVMKPYL